MGKPVTNKSLKAGLKAIGALGKSFGAEALAEFGITSNAVSAQQAGLNSQLGRGQVLLRTLDAGNIRALTTLTARARANQRSVTAKEQSAVRDYGSALGADAAQQFAPARAAAAAGTKTVGSLLQQGASEARIAEVAGGIAAQGVAAQGQAAKYALAQALQQRTIIDNQTLASLTGQMYQTALSYNMQWEMWKKQQDYAAKALEKASLGELKPTVARLTQEAPEIAVAVGDAARLAVGEEGGIAGMDITAAVSAYATSNGFAPTDPQLAVFTTALRSMKTSYAAGTPMAAPAALRQALETMYSGEKGFEKWGAPMLNSAFAGAGAVITATTGAYEAYSSASADSGSSPLPSSLSVIAGQGGGRIGPAYIGGDWYRMPDGTIVHGKPDGSGV